MRVQQLSWREAAGWRTDRGAPDKAGLVLYFGTRAALACGARYRELRAMFPARAHSRLQHGRPDPQRRRERRRNRRGRAELRRAPGSSSPAPGAPMPRSRTAAAKRSATRSPPTISPASSFSPTASTSTAARWSPASPVRRRRRVDHRRARRRRRAIPGNVGRRRLRAAQRQGGGGRLLRQRDAHRPRQRRRLGRIRPAPQITRSERQRALRARRRAGARSLQALSRRGEADGLPGTALLFPAAHPRSAAARTQAIWCAPCWRSTTTRAR